MNRRNFLQASLAAALSTSVAKAGGGARRAPRILLRSSWQVVNIGDIAHTPGVLALIEKHLPAAEVRLWASGDFSAEVAAMEQRRFSKLQIVKGTLAADGKASNSALGEAVAWADFLLHGSGPSLVAAKDVAAFAKHTGKPYGVYGITHGPFTAGGDFTSVGDKEILDQAAFAFFRDSASLGQAKRAGVKCQELGLCPDGAFACDLRDDERAAAFLASNGLAAGKFLCCLSRLRFTPYWTIPEKNRALDAEKHARNQAMKEHDHAALREAIVAVVRETPLKVLLCPEDLTQMAVGKELFWDQLPADVRRRVVWRDKFWLTDEALSTYLQSAGLFGSEMHSPIMAIGHGIPAIVCRFEEQTSKGLMWRDIGLGDWLFDLDRPEEHQGIVPAVLAMAKDPAAAKEKAAQARRFVEQRQRETMAVLEQAVSG